MDGSGSGTRIARRIGPVLIAMLLVGTGVAAVSLLIQQRLPDIPIVPGLTTGCADPALLTANATEIIAGTSGYIRYTCGTGPAFTAYAGAVGTPMFSLAGTAFTKLYIFDSSTAVGSTCAAGVGSMELRNNTEVVFPIATDSSWDYCVRYVDAQLDMATILAVEWST